MFGRVLHLVHLFNELKGRVFLSVRWLSAFNGDPASLACDNIVHISEYHSRVLQALAPIAGAMRGPDRVS